MASSETSPSAAAAQGASAQPILVLSPRDNVGVALTALSEQQRVALPQGALVTAAVPASHKVALRAIAAGEKIIKYGAPIGSARRNIAPGEHVHTHNIQSDYLPPFGREGSSRGKEH